MADIERQILQRVDCDEDSAERSRAAENGDKDRPTDLDEGAGGSMPVVSHDGPQTGAKGVVADYRHAQREERQRKMQEAAAAKAAYADAVAMRSTEDSSGGKTIWTKDSADLVAKKSDDDDDDERFFEEYRQKRIAELSRAAEQSQARVLTDATPEEYAEIVDQMADSGAPVAIILVNDSAVSRRMEGFIRAAAPKYAHATFVRVQAADCGFVDADLVPIVLVYRHGELESNMVRVVDRLPDHVSFELRDVVKLLDSVLLK
ncbi:hypothetical protein GGH91_001271 [Coemansia sp. RSA 2671]|nr:hypothetical protein LPJ60_000423 [Coemansia sp. RSA 2675]KAJ2348641.1 hypothetical protein GGH91_001271 [Coemansia sp. RSA 2671]KAJ2361343.1 hypothetical protein H4S02_011694 [Coemansia sp. RSA 2611]